MNHHGNYLLLCCLVFILRLSNGLNQQQLSLSSNYTVVVDLGSSGSRVFVYKKQDGKVIGLKPKKIKPGISEMAHDPVQAADYLRPIFEYAQELVPSSLHAVTPFHIKATAGVRLLPTEVQQNLFKGLMEQLKIDSGRKLGCPFLISDDYVGVISGDDEGFYAALSVNYLMGSLNSELEVDTSSEVSSTKVFGALDMGGASTQLVFMPNNNNANEKDQTLSTTATTSDATEMQQVEISMLSSDPMQVNYVSTTTTTDKNISNTISRDDFFSRSFLSFGADQIREKLWRFLVSKSLDESSQGAERLDINDGDATMVPNPCSFVGHEVEWEGKKLIGTGDANACALAIRYVLFGDDCEHVSSDAEVSLTSSNSKSPTHSRDYEEVFSEIASEPLCPLDGHETLPQIQDVEFVAMSIYFFALDCMRTLSHLLEGGEQHEHHVDFAEQWPKPSITSLLTAAQPFCALSWEEVSQPHVSHRWTWEDQMPHRCFENVFIATLLKEGYGIHPNERSITYALELEGMEVEWTLGYMLKVSEEK